MKQECKRDSRIVCGCFKMARMCIEGPVAAVKRSKKAKKTITELSKREHGFRNASVVIQVPTPESSADKWKHFTDKEGESWNSSKEFTKKAFLEYCKNNIVVTAADYNPDFKPAKDNKKGVSRCRLEVRGMPCKSTTSD